MAALRLLPPGGTMLNQKLFMVRTTAPFLDVYERFWDGKEWVWVSHGRPQIANDVRAKGRCGPYSMLCAKRLRVAGRLTRPRQRAARAACGELVPRPAAGR
jgi:hypothetical protein